MDTIPVNPLAGRSRAPNLTTVTGLSLTEAEQQSVTGRHHAQNPAVRHSTAAQRAGQDGQVLEMVTRSTEAARPTLLSEHADALHHMAVTAFSLPPHAAMLQPRYEGDTATTAAQVANACMRALIVAAPSGWNPPTPPSEPRGQTEISFDPGEPSRGVLDVTPVAEKSPDEPDPVATLVGDVLARLSGAEQVTLGPIDLKNAKVKADDARTALLGAGVLVDEVNPGVLVVREPRPETVQDPPAHAAAGNQPPAGGGTGDAGSRKEGTPPTQCPYCSADPFGSEKGRNAHIRNKHPLMEVPASVEH